MFNQRIIFIGTSSFALPALEKLIEKKFNIVAVITQPDKKVGRHQKLEASPIKKIALKYKLTVLAPQNIKDEKAVEKIRELKPDLIITASYGQIIPAKIFEITLKGILNIHPSLLPLYRGPSPIQQTILDGAKEAGVTIMLMDKKIDHGPILSQEKINLSNQERAEPLQDKLADLGAKLLTKTVELWLDNKIKPQTQDDAQATFTKILSRDDGRINWQKTAQEIERKVRAYTPWPGTFTIWLGKKLKIIEVKILDSKNIPGRIFLTDQNELAIGCKEQSLILQKVQLEGKKPLYMEEFLKGYYKIIGGVLE